MEKELFKKLVEIKDNLNDQLDHESQRYLDISIKEREIEG